MTVVLDERFKKQVQRLLKEKGNRLGFSLSVIDVIRDSGVVQVLVQPSQSVHSEDYVQVLAAVESELDVDPDETILLVPVAAEE